MTPIIQRSTSAPIREGLSYDELWNGPDLGLIGCWERGREKARREPELAARAISGELVILPFKGGVEKSIKKKQKFGTLFYLAMWQGLRGEDLSIDPTTEPSLVCTATGITVVYTIELAKYADA